jgi:hypothetical protein
LAASSAFVAALASGEWRRTFPGLFSLAGMAAASHLLLDLIGERGVWPAWPLREAHFSFPLLKSDDPILQLGLLLPLVWSTWLKRRGPVPVRVVQRWSTAALVILFIYVGLCSTLRERARQAALSALPDEAGAPRSALAFPSRYSPLLWTTLIRTDANLWHRGYASVLTGGVTSAGNFATGGDDPQVQVALDTDTGRRFRHGTQALFVAGTTPVGADGSYEVTLGDLRFCDPFTERVPGIRLRIGPDFDLQEWSTGALGMPRGENAE